MKANAIIVEDSFDAVKFMRQQRDRISRDISEMSFKEIRDYFDGKSSRKKITKKSPRVIK